MAIEFKKEILQPRFLDPTAKFSEGTRRSEVRFDPLTQRPSHVSMDRSAAQMQNKFDLAPIIEKSRARGCPFCPPLVDTITPKFIPELAPEGRIRVGEACVFPNMSPYVQYSSVCVLSPQHFTPLAGFTQEMLTNGLIASQTCLKRAREYDAKAKHLHIGWNYMMLAGASQPHPHMQVGASHFPTTYEKEVLEASQRYYTTNGTNFWSDLITKEQQLGERYIGDTGSICWLTPFAPRGRRAGEILAIFKHRDYFLDISEQEWKDFSTGLLKVFHDMSDQGFYSFNLAIISATARNDYFWTQARIIPRYTLTELDSSDAMYYEALLDIVFHATPPEDYCQRLKKYFGDNAISH